jgi:hypothetical protein
MSLNQTLVCHAARPATTTLFVVTFAFNEGQHYEVINTPENIKACYSLHHYMLCACFVYQNRSRKVYSILYKCVACHLGFMLTMRVGLGATLQICSWEVVISNLG